MIGLFDSGHGGLTVLRALVERFPRLRFLYLGDHRHVPYGNRPSHEIVSLTRDGVNALFERGCRLVLLSCNTATCVAARTLQRHWLPLSGWPRGSPGLRSSGTASWPRRPPPAPAPDSPHAVAAAVRLGGRTRPQDQFEGDAAARQDAGGVRVDGSGRV